MGPIDLWDAGDGWGANVTCDVGWSEPLTVRVLAEGVVGEPTEELVARIHGIVADFPKLWPQVLTELEGATGQPVWKAAAAVDQVTIVTREGSERWEVQLGFATGRFRDHSFFADFDGRTLIGETMVD